MNRLVAFYDRGVEIAASRIPESFALLLLRVALGGVFWRSGQTKVVESSFLSIDPSQYDLFASEFSGLPLDPVLAVPLTTYAEHIFPVLLFFGVATRFSAGALLLMTLVIQIFVFPDAWWPVHSLWAAMAAILIARGGGLFSLDALLARSAREMSLDEPSLARLMAASQRGDRAAYRALLVGCRRWLERYFARRTAPHQIDDLVQEILVSMHRKLATWDSTRAFLPWLAAIARYRWIDMLRRQRDEAELGDNDAAVGAEDEAVHARLSIDHLMTLLPPKQAQAITLVKIEGASIAEASKICGQSESLVKVNIHRGLKKLASLIESE